MKKDPKDYYVALGVKEDADTDAIKTAYRNKAKRLHPDFNSSPIAAKQFHRLQEAYEILSDPGARATYDRSWKTSSKKSKPTEDAPPKSKATKTKANKSAQQESVKPKSNVNENPKTKPKPEPTSAPDQPVTCQCGLVTAQPRYIEFDLVWGRLTRVAKRSVSGVFCRSCADRAAIRASLITWLAGWWAWPNGPKETLNALLSNIRGGRKPPERNARLLMRQSRAFRARGEMELARNAAEQALTFASNSTLRRDVDSLLMSLSAHPSRTLKNRWAKPGWAPTLQLMPLALIIAVVSMTITLNTPVSLTNLVNRIVAERTIETPETEVSPTPTAAQDVVGRLLRVTADTANLRTGPGANYQLINVLKKDAIVLATESDPSGEWLRVTVEDGVNGFMALSDLSSGVLPDSTPRPDGVPEN